jgi:hypothetical protein
MEGYKMLSCDEAARHGRFETRCDAADEIPMNEEDNWQAWLDLQSDPEYRADFPKPDGVYCV